jgi:hypothetical protein
MTTFDTLTLIKLSPSEYILYAGVVTTIVKMLFSAGLLGLVGRGFARRAKLNYGNPFQRMILRVLSWGLTVASAVFLIILYAPLSHKSWQLDGKGITQQKSFMGAKSTIRIPWDEVTHIKLVGPAKPGMRQLLLEGSKKRIVLPVSALHKAEVEFVCNAATGQLGWMGSRQRKWIQDSCEGAHWPPSSTVIQATYQEPRDTAE